MISLSEDRVALQNALNKYEHWSKGNKLIRQRLWNLRRRQLVHHKILRESQPLEIIIFSTSNWPDWSQGQQWHIKEQFSTATRATSDMKKLKALSLIIILMAFKLNKVQITGTWSRYDNIQTQKHWTELQHGKCPKEQFIYWWENIATPRAWRIITSSWTPKTAKDS